MKSQRQANGAPPNVGWLCRAAETGLNVTMPFQSVGSVYDAVHQPDSLTKSGDFTNYFREQGSGQSSW